MMAPLKEQLSISRLYLSNFRNYETLQLRLSPDPIVIIGSNGAGKTNILEAISFLSPGRGLRNARLNEIDRKTMQDTAPWAVSASVNTTEDTWEIGTGRAIINNNTSEETNKRIVKLDGKPLKSHTELAAFLSVIWLTPQMDPLFLSTASGRRRFLDRLVYNFDSSHAAHMVAYEYARAERSKLLKERRHDSAWLTILERKMAETGVAIAASRMQSIEYVQQSIHNASSIFPKAILSIEGTLEQALNTSPALEVEEKFCHELAAFRPLDAASGRTNAGIHRSDLIVYHQEKQMPAVNCSTGEQKALLLSIILAEARARVAWHKSVPILLLDEVVAHLDDKRRRALFAEIEALGAQVWMTGTDRILFEGIKAQAQMLQIENGKVLGDIC